MSKLVQIGVHNTGELANRTRFCDNSRALDGLAFKLKNFFLSRPSSHTLNMGPCDLISNVSSIYFCRSSFQNSPFNRVSFSFHHFLPFN